MNIIFGHDRAKQLSNRYTVLEIVNLNDIDIDYQCYCLIDGTKLAVTELPTIDHYQKLHSRLIKNIRTRNYSVCKELVSHLHGHWAGEVDTFYRAVLEYIEH